MQNSNSSAGANAEQSTNAEVPTSSPTIGNTNVGCCTSKETAMQRLINYMRSNFHLTDSTEIEFTDSLFAEKEQIIDSFIAGQTDIANVLANEYKKIGFEKVTVYNGNDGTSAEQYFNNTFKK